MYIHHQTRLVLFVTLLALIVSCRDGNTNQNEELTKTSITTTTPSNPSSTPVQSPVTLSLTTAIPTEMPTLVPPFTPTISTPTLVPTPVIVIPTRSTIEAVFEPILDSSNYLLIGRSLWHPDIVDVIPLPKQMMTYSQQPWSQDGEHLVLTDVNDGRIAILSLASGELDYIENIPAPVSTAIWSPNDQYLLYKTDMFFVETTEISVYDLIMEQTIFRFGPTTSWNLTGWSFDSLTFAFISWNQTEGTVDTIEIVDIATGESQVTENPFANYWLQASWSPTENKMVVFGSDPTCGSFYQHPPDPIFKFDSIDLIDLDTNEVIRLRGSADIGECLSNYEISSTPWSPDGQTITYSDEGVICFLNVTSREETCLTELTAMLQSAGFIGAEAPSWSPGGDWISFSLNDKELAGGYVAAVRLDGSDLRISSYRNEAGSFIWSLKRD